MVTICIFYASATTTRDVAPQDGKTVFQENYAFQKYSFNFFAIDCNIRDVIVLSFRINFPLLSAECGLVDLD